MTNTTDPSATTRALIEAVQARHLSAERNAPDFTETEDFCLDCMAPWPCDAIRMADMLAPAVTALEWYEDRRHYWDYEGLNDIYADEGDRARATLRRMAGGDGE